MPSHDHTHAFLSLGLVSALLLLFTIVPPADRNDGRTFDRTDAETTPHEVADPCPEGAVRTRDGACAIPPREALLSSARCEEGQASYAGACWDVTEEALRRILEENESRATEATREGCPSAHVLVGHRCVPMVQDADRHIDMIEEHLMCSAECPEGTACVGGHCIRPLRPVRSDSCPGGPTGLSEQYSYRGCEMCYRGVWYPTCTADNPDSCLPKCYESNNYESDDVCQCCGDEVP